MLRLDPPKSAFISDVPKEIRTIQEDPEFIEFCTNKRFTIRRRLGAGGMGVVYAALDRQRGEEVALKTLRGISPGALYRFKREFRVFADVHHSNLIALHELFSEGEQMFFTMELIHGVDFIEYARAPLQGDHPETSERVHLRRLRSGLRQIFSGLSEIHAAGKLHCDIKPSNVLVTLQGRVVILDFGLVADLEVDTVHSTDHGTMLGTPAYASPEQAAGLAATSASDCYAVGVMMYEALTGQLPFTGSGMAILLAKQDEDPTPPSHIKGGIPEELDRLCLELLQRDPKLRPKAQDVLDRLGNAPIAHHRGASNVRLHSESSVFVGREAQLKELQEAFSATHQGRAVAVHVYGASGLGKTALIHHFVHRLQDAGAAVVLTGRCYERESVSFKALDSLVDALCQYLMRIPHVRAVELIPRDIHALVQVFPILQRVKAVTQAPQRAMQVPDPRELRRRAFAALKELFARIALRRPLVLHIDDLQWGDRDSAALLADLLRPPDAPALLLIVSYRSEDCHQSGILHALDQPADIDTRKLEISPLSVTEAYGLALALLDHSRGDQRTRAQQIAQESQGNPLFISEMVHYADANNEQPMLFEQVLKIRLAGQSEQVRELLEMIAVAGGPIQQDLVLSAVGAHGDPQNLLGALRVEHLIRTHSNDGIQIVEIYHDRIREYMLRQLSLQQLQDYHRRLALALEAMGGWDSDALTVHFREAGELERAGDYAIAAAEQAQKALAFDRAAHLYRLAYELKPYAHHQSYELQCCYANALANAGRSKKAAEAYLKAAEMAEKEQSLELRRRAADQLLRSGEVAEGMATMRTVVEEVGMSFPQHVRQRQMLTWLERLWLRVHGRRFTARPMQEIPRHERLRMEVCRSITGGLLALDPSLGGLFQARHLRLAIASGHRYQAACALAAEVAHVSVRGERSRRQTERVAKAAQALAQQVASPYPRGILALSRGIAAFRLGHWRQSIHLFQHSEEILRNECVGASYEMTLGHSFHLVSLFHMGNLPEIRRQLHFWTHEAKAREDAWALTSLRAGPQNLHWLADDKPEQARQELAQLGQQWPVESFGLQQLWLWMAKVHIDLYAGDSQEGWNRVAQQWDQISTSAAFQGQYDRIMAYYLYACVALLRMAKESELSDSPILMRWIHRIIAKLGQEKALWARPFADILQASLAFINCEYREASGLLHAAEKGFRGADMELMARIVQLRYGQMMGGDEGKQLQTRAEAWMQEQGIKNPVRMAKLCTPGFCGLDERSRLAKMS